MAEAEEIATRAEHIDRCEITHEILSGGNRYVHVDHSPECREILAQRHLGAVEKALEALPKDDRSRLVPVVEENGTEILLGNDNPWLAALWINGSHSQSFGRDNPKTGAYAVAVTLQGSK